MQLNHLRCKCVFLRAERFDALTSVRLLRFAECGEEGTADDDDDGNGGLGSSDEPMDHGEDGNKVSVRQLTCALWMAIAI